MNLSIILRGTLTGALLLLTASSLVPAARAPQPVMISELLQGTERGHLAPGHEFAPLRPHLPPKGILSFIQDTPYDKTQLAPERLLMLQNFLAPLILSPDPGYPFAIVECSTHARAVERAAQTGYRFVYDDQNGRGVLERIS